MKITIEVNVPDGVDLDHAYQSVTDAMYLPQNVTQLEYTMVASILNQLASKNANVILPKGFREWAYTHYEVVYFLERLQQVDNLPKVLEDVLERDYVASIYDLSIEITNEFMDLYKSKEDWKGDWTEAIQEFINAKLQ
jgi:hypothetical protein